MVDVFGIPWRVFDDLSVRATNQNENAECHDQNAHNGLPMYPTRNDNRDHNNGERQQHPVLSWHAKDCKLPNEPIAHRKPARQEGITHTSMVKIALGPKCTFGVKRRPDGPEMPLPLCPRKRTIVGHHGMSQNASRRRANDHRYPRLDFIAALSGATGR
jgi:hypothetical protein